MFRMLRTPRRVFFVAALVGLGSSGCTKQTLPLLGLGVELAANLAIAAAQQPSSSRPDPRSSEEESAGFGTPSGEPVERPMSECEIERGRWREANQDQDLPPRELRCLADGSYPRIVKAPDTPPGTFVAPVDADQLPPVPADAPTSKGDAPETL